MYSIESTNPLRGDHLKREVARQNKYLKPTHSACKETKVEQLEEILVGEAALFGYTLPPKEVSVKRKVKVHKKRETYKIRPSGKIGFSWDLTVY